MRLPACGVQCCAWGGLPAFNADYIDAIQKYSQMVVLLVIGTTLLALVAAFRSILVPVKAVLLNLLSVGAAFGAWCWCSRMGTGSG